MPTYDYHCTACGYNGETFQSITAKPIKKCPACKRNRMERLIGAGAGIIFRGSGFYETDYRSDSYKAQAKKEKETSSSGKDSSSKNSSVEKKKTNGSGDKLKAAS